MSDFYYNPIKTASEWHGGQGSALYSYSSTGKIWGEEHQTNLLVEIERELDRYETHKASGISEDDLACLEYLHYDVKCWPDESV
jgi:hypothetical protein